MGIYDIQIQDCLFERFSQAEFKGNSPQTIVIERDFFGKEDYFFDFCMVLIAQLVGEIFPNFLRGRVIESEVIVEPSRPVDQVVIQPVQIVTGNDKEFFAIGGAIKQAKQSGLRVGFVFAGTDIAEGLIELVEQKNDLLVNGPGLLCLLPGL